MAVSTASLTADINGRFLLHPQYTTSYDLTVGGAPQMLFGASKIVINGSTVTATAAEINAAADNSARFVAGSTSTNLTNYGISTLPSTDAGAYTLADPVAGTVKHIFMDGATTTVNSLTTASTDTTYDGTNTVLSFNAAAEAIILVGGSSTRWYIMTNPASVALSTP